MSRGGSAQLLVRTVRRLPANRWTARGGRIAAAALARLGADVVVPVVLDDGTTMQLDIRGRTEAEAVWHGSHDPDLIEFLAAAAEVRGPNVIDVGANVGLIAVPLARRVAPKGGRVLAIEPVAANYAQLRRSIGLNSLTNIDTLPVAAGAETGTVSLRRDAQLGQTTGNAVIDTGTGTGGALVTDVPVRRLDDIVAETGRQWNVVKIDCEGYDVQVVQGARDLMRTQRPIMWGEFHTELTPRFGSTLSSLRSQLDECDYVAFGFVGAFELSPVTLSDDIGNCALVPAELVDDLLDELARRADAA